MKHLAAWLIGLMLVAALSLDVAGPELVGGRISLANAASIISDARFEHLHKAEPATLNYIPPVEMREWFYNHGNADENGQYDHDQWGRAIGDCVQCSLGMGGVRNNNLKAATLCWDTPFGPKIRGPSGADRVAAYCRERGIKIYNITGRTINDTYPWARWAAETGRGAAIAFGKDHFQWLMGYEPGTKKPWLVCDNNSPWKVDRYTDDEFRAKHAQCCFWLVIFDGPAPPAPINSVIPARKSWSLWSFLELAE